MPVGHFLTDTTDFFCQRAEEMSDGRLKFTHYPAGQIMTDQEVPDNIRLGTIEMSLAFMHMWVELIPKVALYYGPVLPDNLAYYERYNQYCLPAVAEILETDGNTKLVGSFLSCIDSGYITTRPIRKPGDFQGMKIRVATPILDPEVESLGGVPVIMSSADVYMALSQGTIDGAQTILTSFCARHYYEVAKYAISIYPTPLDFILVANLDFWNSLPQDLQQIIQDSAVEAREYSITACIQADEDCRQYLREQGVDVYYPTGELRDAFMEIITEARYNWAVQSYGQEAVNEIIGWAKTTREE